MIRLLAAFGTRPEAIKMAPLVLALKACRDVDLTVCVTGQHREMLRQVLDVFDITPDFDLGLMRPDQSLNSLSVGILAEFGKTLKAVRPHRVLVHGDTTTAFCCGLAAFYERIPVGHAEAGLRTGSMQPPWPEEFNRSAVDLMADLLWAPTVEAAANLTSTGAKLENVFITGNTVVDALMMVSDRLAADCALQSRVRSSLPLLKPGRKLVLVTGHRRESHNGGIADVCKSLTLLVERGDVQVIWPVHPNPAVLIPVRAELGSLEHIHLIEPTGYLQFVELMRSAYLIITDSGGIQEEAPSFKKPVLVTRNETERPEAVAAGTARLIGTDPQALLQEAGRLLDGGGYSEMISSSNPFGDGNAATRIVDSILERHRTQA